MEEFLEDISYLKCYVKVKGIVFRRNYSTLMRIKMFTKQNEDWGKIVSVYFHFNEGNVQKCQRYLDKISELAIMHSYYI